MEWTIQKIKKSKKSCNRVKIGLYRVLYRGFLKKL